jgi:hypothetical protein
MATGFDNAWVVAPPDVRGAGGDEWAAMTGIAPGNPLVGGAAWGGFAPDRGLDAAGALIDAGGTAMPGGAPVDRKERAAWDDWRDLFDLESPMPYILAFVLAAVGFLHFRVQARAGHARAGVAIGRH